MAKRGPKPKPTKLKIMSGVRADRVNAAEPKATGAPVPPGHLSARARAHWDRLVPALQAAGILGAIDSDALALYCETYARWVAAEANIAEFGAVVATTKGGTKLSPYVTLASECSQRLIRLAAEFGMTPSSRSRVNTVPETKKDALAEFLSRKRTS